MVRHWAFLPGLGALVVALLLECRTPPPALPAPFRGIARDPGAVAALRPLWSRTFRDGVRDVPLLRRRATELGEPASRALLEILLDHYRSASWDRWSYGGDDEREEPEGVLVGELATEETARELARAITDRTVPLGMRRAIVVALCRPRFAFAAETLAAIACDRREEPSLRHAILGRFRLLGCPPPARLKDLLYEPYGGIDVLGAAVLATCGEPEAPSLILHALDAPDSGGETLLHCSEAVRRITRRPLPALRAAGTMIERYLPDGVEGERVESVAFRKETGPHAAALREWMAARDETGFERERREYLASEGRAREMRVRTVEDLLDADDDFDIAAASLWLTADSPAEVEASLERLHRLTLLCARRLDRARDAEERIAVLNALLAQVPHRGWAEGDPSRLSRVLAWDDGNCLARTTLYLAVADRLRLPLRAYALPNHVYVAWEEGGWRRNIETTDGGRPRTSAGEPATRRQILAYHLSNRAVTLEGEDRFEEAVRFADKALGLHPGDAIAHACRARAAWQSDLGVDPRPDVDRAAEIVPGNASHWIDSAEMAWKLGDARDALRRAEKAFRIEPTPDAATMVVRAHLALGETRRARETAEEAAKRWPKAAASSAQTTEFREALRSLAFALFELALDREGHAPLDRADVRATWKARALLGRASPARALAILEAAREETLRGPEWHVEGESLSLMRPGALRRQRREFHLLEARALASLGRIDEARAALRAAEEAAPANRETLEVRRLLAGG